jgi:hypothetical protein
MTDVKQQCAVHDVVINRVDEKLNSVICKLDGIMTQITHCTTVLAKHTVELEHLKSSDVGQWKAISEMRKIIYKVVGIAVGVMTGLQILFQLWKN